MRKAEYFEVMFVLVFDSSEKISGNGIREESFVDAMRGVQYCRIREASNRRLGVFIYKISQLASLATIPTQVTLGSGFRASPEPGAGSNQVI